MSIDDTTGIESSTQDMRSCQKFTQNEQNLTHQFCPRFFPTISQVFIIKISIT